MADALHDGTRHDGWRAPDPQLWRDASGVTGASRFTGDQVVLHFAKHHFEHHSA